MDRTDRKHHRIVCFKTLNNNLNNNNQKKFLVKAHIGRQSLGADVLRSVYRSVEKTIKKKKTKASTCFTPWGNFVPRYIEF